FLLFTLSSLMTSIHLRPSFYFSLSILRPQSFTLFPYTTLFRSNMAACRPLVSGADADHHPPIVGRGIQEGFQKTGAVMGAIGIADRKSTRLNSSHVSISYAVFCLKKKKSENSKRLLNK